MLGSLADDIADIFGDLAHGLRLSNWDESMMLWQWRFPLNHHWGDHAIAKDSHSTAGLLRIRPNCSTCLCLGQIATRRKVPFCQVFARPTRECYNLAMVIIRFTDDAAKRRALGWLVGRFSFKSWTGGQMLVPEAALAQLALQDIPFISEGPATYEQILTSLRNPAAASVQ